MCLIKLGSYNTPGYAVFIMILFILRTELVVYKLLMFSDPYFPVFLDSINPHPNSKIEKCIVQKNN